MKRDGVKTETTFDFRQLEAAAERVIALGHSIKDKQLALEKGFQKLDRHRARASEQITTLAQSLLTSFPKDITAEDLSRGEGVVEVALRLLEELKERRAALSPYGDEQ